MLGSTAFIFWLAIRTVSAQTHESAFGEVRSFALPDKFENSKLVSWDAENATVIAVWTAHRKEILLATFDSTLTSVNYDLKYTAVEFDDLHVADFNGDGALDIMLVNRQNKSVAFVLDSQSDSLRVTNTTKLPFEPDRFLICDYNNDKRLDVLVYNRKVPGILPLIGNGKGRFSIGKIIAPDNAVGAADFAQVNNDNLTDVILWDWVKSEIHVLYGVGKGKFIDQSVFPVQGEVETLAAVSMFRSRSLDLMLKMSMPSGFQVWEGNDLGDFQMKNYIPVEGSVNDFGLADVNNDGLNDIVFLKNNASLQAVFNNETEAFSDRIEYASGDAPQKIIFSSRCEKCPQDVIVFDRADSQFLVYKNVARSGVLADSVQFVTGISPTEIIANDFNRDGISDIALLNTKSQSLSFYWGRKSAVPFGPFSYSLTDKPNHLAFHSSTDTTIQLVLSFPRSHQISYFTLNAADNSISNAFIGTEGAGEFIVANMNNHQTEFVTLNTTASEDNSLSFYEQLGATTFIERTFRLSPPDYLLGASIADLNRDGFPGIVYAYRSGDTSMVELGIAFGDSTYSMKHRVISKELVLSDVKRIFIWLADFDVDSVLDVLIQAGTPADFMMIAKGKGDGLFYDLQVIASGFAIKERSNVQIVDVDGDGLSDIVVGAQKDGQVIWLRNLDNCSFSPKKILAVEPGLSHYVVADIDADGINDLAMTIGKKGILKIINGKQLPLHAETSTR